MCRSLNSSMILVVLSNPMAVMVEEDWARIFFILGDPRLLREYWVRALLFSYCGKVTGAAHVLLVTLLYIPRIPNEMYKVFHPSMTFACATPRTAMPLWGSSLKVKIES
jgi:hypothetical protein